MSQAAAAFSGPEAGPALARGNGVVASRRNPAAWGVVLAVVLLLGISAGPGGSAVAAEVAWILVDTDSAELRVMQGGRVVERFEHIAIGRGGRALDRLRGDETTPLGTYRIAWINEDSPFHRFFAFDYPTAEHADRAYTEGRIDAETHAAIVAAAATGEVPPQDTVLGGRLGIHGLGAGDARIHARFNWTQGCIALTNEQVDRLAPYITLGTQVVVE